MTYRQSIHVTWIRESDLGGLAIGEKTRYYPHSAEEGRYRTDLRAAARNNHPV